jgi:hypothetical protein
MSGMFEKGPEVVVGGLVSGSEVNVTRAPREDGRTVSGCENVVCLKVWSLSRTAFTSEQDASISELLIVGTHCCEQLCGWHFTSLAVRSRLDEENKFRHVWLLKRLLDIELKMILKANKRSFERRLKSDG